MRLLLLSVFALLSFSSVLVSATVTTPTCKLTQLVLYDSVSGGVIDFTEAFSSTKYEYTAKCKDYTTKVQVYVNANDQQTTYDMRFKGALGAIDQQYLALNVASKQLTMQEGKNEIDINPSCTACSAKYIIWCTKPPAGGHVVGDPQFTGLRGQNYQVHGVSGEVYSIITDQHLQMNSKFVFLNKGSCPVVDGKKMKGCWSHPGSYLGEIGIKTAGGDKLKIVSGRADQGFALIELNGVPMKVGQQSDLANADSTGFVSFNNSHLISVTAGNFQMEFENSDLFINQRVRVIDWSTLRSHGLLGQTWRNKVYNNPVKHIEGAVDDYVVRAKDLFGDNFLYNQFGKAPMIEPIEPLTTPVDSEEPATTPVRPVLPVASTEDETVTEAPVAPIKKRKTHPKIGSKHGRKAPARAVINDEQN